MFLSKLSNGGNISSFVINPSLFLSNCSKVGLDKLLIGLLIVLVAKLTPTLANCEIFGLIFKSFDTSLISLLELSFTIDFISFPSTKFLAASPKISEPGISPVSSLTLSPTIEERLLPSAN